MCQKPVNFGCPGPLHDARFHFVAFSVSQVSDEFGDAIPAEVEIKPEVLEALTSGSLDPRDVELVSNPRDGSFIRLRSHRSEVSESVPGAKGSVSSDS